MKFSIVTPVHNGERYIAETIESVLSQEGDFEIEYIIQDGQSTDKTLSIIKSYEDKLKNDVIPIKCNEVTLKYYSQKDSGMYDAINRGFAQATGDIYAYINSDDLYLPGSFSAVAAILTSYPEIEWLKGITNIAEKNVPKISKGTCFVYRQNWLMKGLYGRSAYFIQQDSVFWKKSLWLKTKTNFNSFRLAGDYSIWVNFAKNSPLWSFNKEVSVFRRRPGQLSESMDEYRNEQNKIAPHDFFLEKRVILFFSLTRLFKITPASKIENYLFLLLFPFYKQEWYIDFDNYGNPVKKVAQSYFIPTQKNAEYI